MSTVRHFVDKLFRPLSIHIAKTLNLPKFVPHAPVFYISFASYTLVFLTAPYFSRLLFPKAYSAVSKRHTYGWRVHMVSMSHALTTLPWALYLLGKNMPAVADDKAFGWDERLGDLQAVSAAYFVWDTLESALSGAGFDFVLHVSTRSSLHHYLDGGLPTVHGLLWTEGTPLGTVNAFPEYSLASTGIQFLDKVGKTGTPPQLVNAGFLLTSFLGARLIYGPYISYDFLRTMWSVRHEVSPVVTGSFAAGNIALNFLNYMWFSKMIAAIQKRFKKTPPDGTKDPETVLLDGQVLQLPEGETLKAAMHVQDG
ncbi:hypothetical protein FRB90_000464 [Tulasnella sp. 427]|nr:hypothetical protein FRB90_000464 [Tulasnella sp. 427]